MKLRLSLHFSTWFLIEDDGPDEEEVLPSPYTWYPSEEGFKESDLASRKKRRYVIGTHSFLDLADPKLEDALEPVKGGQPSKHLPTTINQLDVN
jgi:hypothetical protein